MAINGDAVLLSVHDTAGYRALVCLENTEISSDGEVLESKNKCNPGVISKEYGSISNTVSGDGDYKDDSTGGSNANDASYRWLREKQAAKTKFTVRITTGLTEAVKQYLYGTAIVSNVSLNAPAGETSKFNVTLDIDGGLTETDPHP